MVKSIPLLESEKNEAISGHVPSQPSDRLPERVLAVGSPDGPIRPGRLARRRLLSSPAPCSSHLDAASYPLPRPPLPPRPAHPSSGSRGGPAQMGASPGAPRLLAARRGRLVQGRPRLLRLRSAGAAHRAELRGCGGGGARRGRGTAAACRAGAGLGGAAGARATYSIPYTQEKAMPTTPEGDPATAAPRAELSWSSPARRGAVRPGSGRVQPRAVHDGAQPLGPGLPRAPPPAPPRLRPLQIPARPRLPPPRAPLPLPCLSPRRRRPLPARPGLHPRASAVDDCQRRTAGWWRSSRRCTPPRGRRGSAASSAPPPCSRTWSSASSPAVANGQEHCRWLLRRASFSWS
ncbi:hypothetical protein ACQJBY_000308 [Aegilops geniculata]